MGVEDCGQCAEQGELLGRVTIITLSPGQMFAGRRVCRRVCRRTRSRIGGQVCNLVGGLEGGVRRGPRAPRCVRAVHNINCHFQTWGRPSNGKQLRIFLLLFVCYFFHYVLVGQNSGDNV